MGMFKDIYTYCKCVFKHWYVIGFSVLIGGLGGVQDLTAAFSDKVVIPTWVWVSVLVVGLMAAQYLAWRDMKIEKDKRRKYEVLQNTLYKLSQFRDEVIKFQNRPAIDTASFEAWIHEFDELREKRIDTIDKEISPAEAGIFRTIGLFEMHTTKRPAGLSNLQHELIDNYRSRSIRDHKWLTSLIISYRGKA